ERAALARHGDFLAMLEVTLMTRSYKMLVLLAMLNAETFPGEIGIDELTRRFAELASRSATLRADVGRALDNPGELRRLIERNPVAAWTGGWATGGTDYFAYDRGRLHTTARLTSSDPEVLRDLVRELVDWRLAEYLDRPGVVSEEPAEYRTEVIGQSTPT